MQSLERVASAAQQLLVLNVEDERRDLWLWERAQRVARLTQFVGRIPEVADQAVDLLALAAAGLFHCAGWATQFQQRRVTRWQLLSRPTNDIQRELAAAALHEHAAHHLPPKTGRLAAEAIRQCNDRGTSLLEAQLLGEAENLDDVGVMHVLRQFRQFQAEGRPLNQIVSSWERQQEYRYWDIRLQDGFRFETTRQRARERLRAVDIFVQALARDLDGADMYRALQGAGIAVDADPLKSAAGEPPGPDLNRASGP